MVPGGGNRGRPRDAGREPAPDPARGIPRRAVAARFAAPEVEETGGRAIDTDSSPDNGLAGEDELAVAAWHEVRQLVVSRGGEGLPAGALDFKAWLHAQAPGAAADTHETSSPSMDISKASNFERFVFDLLGRDGARVKSLFGEQLGREGRFDLSGDAAFRQARERYGFISGKSTHADRIATIRDTHARFGVTIDTHTADGLKVAREHLTPGVPMIVLETALPIKFAESIVEALGHEPERPAKFEGIEQLPKRVTVMAADADAVKGFIARHCG